MEVTNHDTANNNVVEQDYNPLAEPVKKRTYTTHNVAEVDATPLGEPVFIAPTLNDFEESDQDNGGSSKNNEENETFNPKYSELDGKEKTMGAKMMVEMTLDLYAKGCNLMGKLAEIPESKLDRLIAEGEIDSEIVVPTQDGNLPAKEFAEEYNSSIKDAFAVSEDFVEKVKPPLERVFKKRGIGMTDEQLLIYYFATDFGAKGVQCFMLRKTANGIIDSLKEHTLAMREQSNFQNRSAAPANASNMEVVRDEAKTTVTEEFNEKTIEVHSPEIIKEERIHATGMGDQLENFDIEEPVYQNLMHTDGFATAAQEPSNMPNFGDKEILAGIDKIDKLSRESTSAKSNRPTKRSVPKPRGNRKNPPKR